MLEHEFEYWLVQRSVNLAVLREDPRVARAEEDAGSVLGSLLKCTDQFDSAICLANEMMTYGGNMNSFDEALLFLMQSSGLEGGVYLLCLCGSHHQLAPGSFSSSPHLAENCLCVCVRACACVCVCLCCVSAHRLHCIPVSF